MTAEKSRPDTGDPAAGTATADTTTGDLPTGVPGDARYRTVDGRRFHVVEAGPETGELVVLLHGFPEFWYGWRDQIAPLADAGYRVLVPDQRGYNRSTKPESVSSYRIDRLAEDVSGLIESVGRDSAHVVGHDWGGVVGWWLALHNPESVERLVTANAPHPTVIRRTLSRDPAQAARTSYALAFQLPAVPEAVSRAFDWRLPTTMMRRTAMPGSFDAQDFRRYRAAWERDSAFTTMLHWYRANGRSRPDPETDDVTVPTRVIWGAEDRFLKTQLAHDSLDFCADGRLTLLSEATHWCQHDVPVKVSDAILDELGGPGGSRAARRRPD
jgi:pimeloyl-ACP methyl ester carboxylesterase